MKKQNKISYRHSAMYTFIFSIISLAAIFVLRFLKLSLIVGSYRAFFSMNSIALPLAGIFGTTFTSFIIFFIRCFLHSHISFAALAFYIPGLCSSLYWNRPGIFTRFLLPLCCFIAFVAHPIGSAAYLYACYWIIPLVIYLSNTRNLFAHSLGSTFVAHAVGSTIWLYTIGMTPAAWLSLIPLVAIERLCYASGIFVGYHAVSFSTQKIKLYLHRLRYSIASSTAL